MAAEEDGSMDNFIKKRLKCCKISSKGMITGYLETKQAYDDLIRDLKVYGCTYSVRSCSVGKPEKGSLQFRTFSSDLQIPFTGSPFHIEGTTYHVCTQGIRYYKCKALQGENREDEDENEAPQKKRRKVNKSIKVGCPAKMTVKCVRVYPDYKTPHESWRRKNDVLKRLKAALKASPPPPRSEVHYWIALSTENVHTHKRTATQKIQLLHPDLIAEIHRLVGTGVTSIPAIKSHLQNFVGRMFSDSDVKPDPSNTAFFPSDKSIYNHAHEAKLARSRQQGEPDSSSAGGNSILQPKSPCVANTITSSPVEHSEESSEKTESEMSVDNLDAPFWQDQTVLPGNLVQVVNNHGTIVFMVTQPMSDQMTSNQLDGAIGGASSGLVNVNLDDSIYAVSVSDSSGRILGLSDELILRQNCDDISNGSEISSAAVNTKTSTLIDEKANASDMNRVITVEGNVVLDVRQSSLEDREGNMSPHHEQSDGFTFKSHLPIHLSLQQTKEEELQQHNRLSESPMEVKRCIEDGCRQESDILDIDFPMIQQHCIEPQQQQQQQQLQQQHHQQQEHQHHQHHQQQEQGHSQSQQEMQEQLQHQQQVHQEVQEGHSHIPHQATLALQQCAVQQKESDPQYEEVQFGSDCSHARKRDADDIELDSGHLIVDESVMDESIIDESAEHLTVHENRHRVTKRKMDCRNIKDELEDSTEGKLVKGKLLPLREKLRDCAQDIINLSYSCVNHNIVEEAFVALEKYRQLMLSDVARKERLSSSVGQDCTAKKDGLNPNCTDKISLTP